MKTILLYCAALVALLAVILTDRDQGKQMSEMKGPETYSLLLRMDGFKIIRHAEVMRDQLYSTIQKTVPADVEWSCAVGTEGTL